MIAIAVKNLTKSYRRSHLGRVIIQPAVKNLTFDVFAGEIFGLIGLNGAGKTTTIKLLLGLLFPDSGQIKIFDRSILSDRSVLSRVGYLPELPYLEKNLRVGEVLHYFGQLNNISSVSRRVEEILEMVGLKKFQKQLVGKLSKGMMQRLCLAQSLLHNPDLLIYDEPASGLDPLGIREIRNLLLYLRSQRKTILISSHLISELEQVCDRVAILAGGELKKIVTARDFQSRGELETIFLKTISLPDTTSENISSIKFTSL